LKPNAKYISTISTRPDPRADPTREHLWADCISNVVAVFQDQSAMPPHLTPTEDNPVDRLEDQPALKSLHGCNPFRNTLARPCTSI